MKKSAVIFFLLLSILAGYFFNRFALIAASATDITTGINTAFDTVFMSIRVQPYLFSLDLVPFLFVQMGVWI